MGQVIPFPKQPAREIPLSKRQLMVELGFSKRWVEMRMREGMPHEKMANGHTRFYLSAVLEWLDGRRSA